MPLFKITGNSAKKILSKELDLEKNLQKLFEQNLEEILNIVFLAHEYPTSFGGRIDTLGIDKNGAPCIIEYKKSQNDNVINQGLSYLKWLLDHKDTFSAICRDRNLDIEVDWESPRVICIAESYSKFDLDTADILNINIELLRYRLYADNLLSLDPENHQKVNIPTAAIYKKAKALKGKNTALQHNRSLEEHLAGVKRETIELFNELRARILNIDQNIKEEPKYKYVAYKTTTNFTDIVVLKSFLKIFLNVKSGQLNDPRGLARDLTKPKPIGHWGNGDYEISYNNSKDADAIFELIKQSYDFNK